MREHYIKRGEVLDLIEESMGNDPKTDALLEKLMKNVDSIPMHQVVSQNLYRRSEYDKNKALNQLSNFEKEHDIIRCAKCRYAIRHEGRYWCSQFTIKGGEETTVPSEGYCAWGRPRESK